MMHANRVLNLAMLRDRLLVSMKENDRRVVVAAWRVLRTGRTAC